MAATAAAVQIGGNGGNGGNGLLRIGGSGGAAGMGATANGQAGNAGTGLLNGIPIAVTVLGGLDGAF